MEDFESFHEISEKNSFIFSGFLKNLKFFYNFLIISTIFNNCPKYYWILLDFPKIPHSSVKEVNQSAFNDGGVYLAIKRSKGLFERSCIDLHPC